MTTLTLTAVWLNLLPAGEAVSAMSSDRSQVYGMDGDIRTYAGGRQRSISQEGEHGQFTVTLRLVSLATVALLRTWKGRTVLFRDHRGQSLFGVIHQVTPTEHRDSVSLYDATVTIRMVTQAEGV